MKSWCPERSVQTTDEIQYACNRCLTQMIRRGDTLYRTCDCKKSGYIPADDTIEDAPEDMILMPFHAPIVDVAREPEPNHLFTQDATAVLLAQLDKLRPAPEPNNRSSQQNVLRTLPDSCEGRKALPITTGVIDYFPLALAAVAELSKAGNDQHNPGEPLHWARGKSSDHPDCIVRHLIDRGTRDGDGIRHSAKVAWRALAMLQEEIEAEAGWTPDQG